jgi:2-polyprenyl-3-methyl-5-hydroxy-6-metoxy-1,4-benzoquinol methylase
MTNPELDQDRAFDLYDTYKKYGYVMFPQQRRIYERLQRLVYKKKVLEAGCGNGVGSAILDQSSGWTTATDKLSTNIDFAKELYPWINFDVWDINLPLFTKSADVVVAVEVIEHVADPVTALKNLINAATETMWISTPNGKNVERPPSNPHHVLEYTVREMLHMLHGYNVKILAWDDFRELDIDTDITPLVYKVEL